MKQAEGFMAYFDRIDPMQDLCDEDYGAIMRAVHEYARYGVLPDEEFPKDRLAFFRFWKSSIDFGRIKYAETCIVNSYKAAVGRYRKNDRDRPEFSEWYITSGQYDPMLFQRQPWYSSAAAAYRRMQGHPAVTITNQSGTESDQKPEHDHELELYQESEHGNENKLKNGRKSFIPPTISDVEEYCRERGNAVDAERFIDYYTANGWKVGRNPMKDWKAAVRTWEKEEGKRRRSDMPIKEQQRMSALQESYRRKLEMQERELRGEKV